MNAAQTLAHFRRNHPQGKTEELAVAEASLKAAAQDAEDAETRAELRGIEGSAAHIYFRVFGHMILKETPELQFKSRNRRRQQEIEVPELEAKVPQGLLPHLAAKKLAAYLRGELPNYHPIRWR